MRHARMLCLAAAGMFAAPLVARAADEVAFDHWFAHFDHDRKVGWSRERRVHSTDHGVPVWVSETEMLLVRGPDGSKLAKPIHSSSRFVEDEAGRVVSYETSFDLGMPSGPQTRKGTVAKGTISATHDGKPFTFAYPEGAVGPAAVDRAVVSSLKPDTTGEVVEFRAIDPASSGKLTWTVHGMTETVNLLGRHVWLARVEKMDESGIPDELYPDAGGGAFAGATNFGLIRWVRAEEAIAKADSEPAALLTSRIVAPDRAIASSPKPPRITLRLSRKGGTAGNLPEGSGQRIAARGKDGSVDVEVTSGEPPASTPIAARPYAGKADVAKWLAPTPLVATGDKRVVAYADAAVGQLVNSLRASRMIELFVHDNLESAPAGPAFGTASEAISSSRGDFSEAAVLAVGLARAAGIPARLVAGFVYWPADALPGDAWPRGGFAVHTWAELLIADGVWYPIDPLRMDGTHPTKHVDELAGHGGFDATHVAVLRSDLNTERPFADILKPVLDFMDGLTIQVLDPAPTDGGK